MKDFPKLYSPFVRDRSGSDYRVTQEIDPEYSWVFEDGVVATDKLDGTNVCIKIEDGFITAVQNRATPKKLLHVDGTGWERMCVEGLLEAIDRGWLKGLGDGEHFGELIGPRINDNRHKVDRNLFVPFQYLRGKCSWKSWSANKYPKDYESLSEWFKTLPSLFNLRMDLPEIEAEGLVFTHSDGRMAKLRRDMFPWYKGEAHKKS